MTARDYLFIVNPGAGTASPRARVSRIREWCQRRDTSFRIEVTGSREEAYNASSRAADHGFTHVVAVGGDGTIHAIVNGLVGTGAGLGIIPAGSGNDFAKAVQVPTSFEGALHVLENGKENRVDIGRMGPRYFINGMGIGMDGAIARGFQTNSGVKGGTGYALTAMRKLFSFRGFDVHLTLPEKRFAGKALFLSISNGPVQGGCFRLAPEASLTDGLLDVHLTRDVSILRRLMNLPRWFYGRQERLTDVEIVQASTVEIELPHSVPAHMDGEPFSLSSGTHRVEVLNRALSVIGTLNA